MLHGRFFICAYSACAAALREFCKSHGKGLPLAAAEAYYIYAIRLIYFIRKKTTLLTKSRYISPALMTLQNLISIKSNCIFKQIKL
ncbi:hypothetical protein TcarDRAFT_2723 [Thermosinus carboxydivorans Nor1]|uniref:Uncharacterized protein n=1 Tax=Thermosinus carboxydivorans Nor1 TaxID=401526 RepID=A1HLR6_9FIRM|nr:hypothetical protein TcarDRAFT_2723 [Thermosinus carboxydivorans Nor1]